MPTGKKIKILADTIPVCVAENACQQKWRTVLDGCCHLNIVDKCESV